jgi:hypothetical protein
VAEGEVEEEMMKQLLAAAADIVRVYEQCSAKLNMAVMSRKT